MSDRWRGRANCGGSTRYAGKAGIVQQCSICVSSKAEIFCHVTRKQVINLILNKRNSSGNTVIDHRPVSVDNGFSITKEGSHYSAVERRVISKPDPRSKIVLVGCVERFAARVSFSTEIVNQKRFGRITGDTGCRICNSR